MNITWYKEFLADEWTGWDLSTFNKYELNDKDLFFGWWLTGDVQSSRSKINKIFKLLNNCKKDLNGEYLGNSYEVLFNPNKIIICKLSTTEKMHYSIDEFELALLEWEFKLNQTKE